MTEESVHSMFLQVCGVALFVVGLIIAWTALDPGALPLLSAHEALAILLSVTMGK